MYKCKLFIKKYVGMCSYREKDGSSIIFSNLFHVYFYGSANKIF